MFDIFLNLSGQITPLLILVALGFISGRFMDVNLHSMAIIAIYILAPFVNFGALVQLNFTPDYIVLPVFAFTVSVLIGVVMYKLGTHFWREKAANLIAMSAVTGNTGYFGIPIVLFLFGPEWLGVYLFMNLGLSVSEIGLGYYFGARGNADVKGAVIKVLRLPVVHAIWVGLLANWAGFTMPQTMMTYWDYAVGAWIIIGMMLIGVALGKQDKLDIDARLIGWLYAPRFILWPLVGVLFVIADMYFFHLYGAEIYTLVMIFCSVPLAGNTVAFAADLNLYPERAAAAVLISTVMAMFFLPFTVWAVQAVLL